VLNYLAAFVVSATVVVVPAATVVSAFTTVESVVGVSVVDAPPQEVKNAVTATIVKNFFMVVFFVFV
jgi:hypothetical protein